MNLTITQTDTGIVLTVAVPGALPITTSMISDWASATASFGTAGGIELTTLPTSSSGLHSGDLWLNNGVLTLVP